jgi:HEPN domain-containing protein
MEEIDREIGDSDLLFHQRPMHAFCKLTAKIDPKGVFPFTGSEAVSADDFSHHAICSQVHRWYEERYGDRIKIHMGPGSYVLMIRNEPWKVEFPLCYGRNNFTIDSDLSKNKRFIIANDGQKIPSVNILSHVENMTYRIAQSLSDMERESILKDYIFALNSVQHLRSLKDTPYMEQAMNDYDMAINNIFYKYPDYNNAKWSALQFAEKSLKSKLLQSNITFKRNHNLSSLAENVVKLGIKIPTQVIENIQCTAGVRYGETKVNKQEAILAIKSALTMYSELFHATAFELSGS